MSNGNISIQNLSGFDSYALLPVVEALPFAPIVNVCLVDKVAFVLVFVALVGGDGGGEVGSENELMAE
jgi:hypothetical protein